MIIYFQINFNTRKNILEFSKYSTSKLFVSTNLDNNMAYSPITLMYILNLLSLDSNNVENQINSYKIGIYNSLWVDENIILKDKFIYAMSECNIPIYAVNFFNQKMVSRSISNWISSSNNSDTDIIVTLPRTIQLAAISTLQLDLMWITLFDSQKNSVDTFYGNDFKQEVIYMEDEFLSKLYYENEDFQQVSLPFENGYSISFILPSEHDSIDTLMLPSNTKQIVEPDFIRADVTLKLPKINYFSYLDLSDFKSEFLSNNGYIDKISIEQIDISTITQNIHVKIDERGCIANSYTIGSIRESAALETGKKVILNFNKPFMFIINSQENFPLIIGVINEP